MTRVMIQARDSTSSWVHATIDWLPPHAAGETEDCIFVVGRPDGGTRAGAPAFWGIDVKPKSLIAAGQRRTFVLDHATPIQHKLEMPSAALSDPLGYFGVPSLLGTPFALCYAGGEPIVANGAHYEIHLRIRGVPLCFDLRLRWYPGDSELLGTLRVTNSDERYPSNSFRIPSDIPVIGLAGGDWIGNGQSRVVPVRYSLQRHTLTRSSRDVDGFGLESIGPLGVIAPRGAYDQAKWFAYAGDTHDRLFDWGSTQIGVSKRSGDAGDQEDQGFSQGFEPFIENADLSVITIGLEAAWNQAKRPCHHLAADGQPLDPEAQTPRLVYWQGTVHYDRNVSPNRLGKASNLTEADTHGWWGPDNEHFLINRIAGAYETTGDMALHDELVHHAMVYLGSETVDPKVSNTRLFVARALGWHCLAMTHCYRLLRDRKLAERVKDRVAARIAQHRVHWGNGLWDVRPNPGNLMGMPFTTAPFFAMTYQNAVGVFGVYVACRVMGLRIDTEAWAAQAAKKIVDLCYPDGDEILGLDAASNVTARRNTGAFKRAWLPLALHVALRGLPPEDPVFAKARDAWVAIHATAPNSLTEWSHFDDWLPPLVAPEAKL